MRTSLSGQMLLSVLVLAGTALGQAEEEKKKPEFPPFDQVAKDFEKVVSTADGSKSLYTVYVNEKKNQMLAELPANFEKDRIFIATSIAGGSTFTGYQVSDRYCYWTRLDDELLLIAPNLERQARGGKQDAELRSSVKRTYSDRVITSVKILTMGPGRGPVIDLDDLLIKNSQLFTGMSGKWQIATVGKVKAFPQNIEVPVTIPVASGELTTLHYSISTLPKTDYKPRESDERIGYFLTVFKDLTKSDPDGKNFVRNINRWNLQKRDSSLRLSPPRDPIVFYIEHTVPVRYRRYVAEGILEWNKAFEKVGILNAVEVRQQDAETKAFMDIDPEDVRYNFFRWISSERAFAMGPSRVNPETGEILDADIIFDDSMLKLYALRYQQMIEAYGFDGVSPEAMHWIHEHPEWDPMARYEQFNPIEEAVKNDPGLSADQKADLLGLAHEMSGSPMHTNVVQQNFYCNYAMGKAMQMRTAQLALRMMGDGAFAAEGPDNAPTIDGVPEEYLGGVLREIVMHEVGHTLGLRHNFKASTWLTLDEYRATESGKANVGSVMDYNPIYVPPTLDEPKGQWVTPTLGPYDYWAIEYGYTLDDKKLDDISKRVATPELVYATDEDTGGPDPYVNRFDLGAEPMDWAAERLMLVKTMRERLMDKALKDGQSWHMLRQAYEQLLGEQLGAIRVASRYIGGVQVNRDRKGDPDGRDPLVPVAPDKQRAALKFLIDNAFQDEAFDLRPEVLAKLATDKHVHWGNYGGVSDPAFSIHDRVAQIQAFAILFAMNPTTLKQVYDNELRTPADQDAITLPEIVNAICGDVYRELGVKLDGATFTNREPMISSLRRNLQAELTGRLIALSLQDYGLPQPIRTLATQQLRELNGKLDGILGKKRTGQVDDYTTAHLEMLNDRVDRALEAVVIMP